VEAGAADVVWVVSESDVLVGEGHCAVPAVEVVVAEEQ
jgi:hypothetical protein